MTFNDNDFSINDSLAKREFRYRYQDVREVAIRNRALHMDLRFSNGTRERLVSSYLQNIANELKLRNDAVAVTFETYAVRFELGSQALRERLNKSSTLARANAAVGAATGFVRPSQQISPEIAQVSDKYRDALLVQEQQIDQISDVLGDLHYQAHAIVCTLFRLPFFTFFSFSFSFFSFFLSFFFFVILLSKKFYVSIYLL